MNTKELEAKLEQAKYDTEQNVKAVQVAGANEVERIEALIEAKKKPKLRHGDYGFHPYSEFTGEDHTGRIVLSCDMRMVTAGNGSVHNVNEASGKVYYPSPVIGNIFDDLKELEGKVDAFQRVSVESDNSVMFSMKKGDLQIAIRGGRTVVLPIDDTVLNLRKMQATSKL